MRPGGRPRKLKPLIDRTFAFDDIVHAHRYREAGAQAGKIVVAV
ncbi:zinc-binding dehydrogenase [Burkholderia cepacia]